MGDKFNRLPEVSTGISFGATGLISGTGHPNNLPAGEQALIPASTLYIRTDSPNLYQKQANGSWTQVGGLL